MLVRIGSPASWRVERIGYPFDGGLPVTGVARAGVRMVLPGGLRRLQWRQGLRSVSLARALNHALLTRPIHAIRYAPPSDPMSTESSVSFFAEPSNSAVLRRFVQDLGSLPRSSIAPEGLTHQLTQILNLMLANAAKFDEFASANIEWIGSHFISSISECFDLQAEQRPAAIKSIFTSAYRFICELEFCQPGDPSFEVRRIIKFVHDNLEAFEGADRQQLVYAAYTMPANVAKKLIGDPSITEFRQFSETVEASRKLKEQWDSDLDKRQKLLDGLKENIQTLTSEYNFVGLVEGFGKLKKDKDQERIFAFLSLILIGFAMLAVPAGQLVFVIERLAQIEDHKTTLVYSLPTIIAVEIILLYFFRVVLGQFRSVKAQLTQVDLRISLCQFIESYAEYVSKLREKDSSALGKFEALIFSNLVTGESPIPSTFDGVEQIANLLKSVRSGAKE